MGNLRSSAQTRKDRTREAVSRPALNKFIVGDAVSILEKWGGGRRVLT